MKFGLYGLHKGDNVQPETIARRAKLAEAVGFESIWVGDHIALPEGLGPTEEPRLEAVVALSHLAALTTTIRLAFGIIVLPQRQPVLLAKQVSSIDALSSGRLMVGVGVGYVEAELYAMGVTLAERDARADEYLDAMHALWSDVTPSFDGRFVSFAGVVQRPRPVQAPHPPIVIGGHSRSALSRAVRRASGWYGWELSPEAAAEAIGALREEAARLERASDLGDLEITITPDAPVDLALARKYARAGVHRLVLPYTSAGSTADELIALARDELIGRV